MSEILTKELAEKFLRDPGAGCPREHINRAIKIRAGRLEPSLRMCEFTSIEDAAAESVSKYQGLLNLDGITKLTDASAEFLSKHQGLLWLGGVTELSDAAADALSGHHGRVFPNDFSHLEETFMRKHFESQQVGLQIGLTELNDAVAEALSKHQGGLGLRRLTKLSDAAAESLSRHQGRLNLNGLTELSDSAAKALAKHQPRTNVRSRYFVRKIDLSFEGLKEISDTAAKALSKHQGMLALYGIKKLSKAATEALSKHQGKINGHKPSVWTKDVMKYQAAEEKTRKAKTKKVKKQPGFEVLRQRAIGQGLATEKNVDEIISNLPIEKFKEIRGEFTKIKRMDFNQE